MADGWAEFRPPCEAPRPPVPVGLPFSRLDPCGRQADDRQTTRADAAYLLPRSAPDMGRAAEAASPIRSVTRRHFACFSPNRPPHRVRAAQIRQPERVDRPKPFAWACGTTPARLVSAPSLGRRAQRATDAGEVAEWLKAPHSKCGVPARVPRVRIPPSPPTQNRTANAGRSRFHAAGGGERSEQIAL
jgi:hypothetical protein